MLITRGQDQFNGHIDYLKIEDDANVLLNALDITGPPVPSSLVKKIFPTATIDFIHFSDEADGFTFSSKANDRWHFLINSSSPFGRQRFTLFHEFYHALNGSIGFSKSSPDHTRNSQERSSDYFAACTLMPARWVRKYWDHFSDLPAKIRVSRMAQVFGVSIPAMEIRIKNLRNYLSAQ